MILIVVLFFALTLAMFILPFVPGLREIRARRDALALPVSPDALVGIRHFANGFRAFLDREMGAALAQVRASGVYQSGWIEDQGQYFVMPGGESVELYEDERLRGVVDRFLASTDDLRIPGGLHCLRELYAGGALHAGAGTELRAALAEGDIVLDSGGRSNRWVHAGGTLTAHEACKLLGRASADHAIALDVGCVFERLHAPTVRFGPSASPVPAANVPLPAWQPRGLKPRHELAAGRMLVEGDLDVPARVRVTFDLVVWGRLTIGEGAHLEASAKSHQIMTLGPHVRVDGSLVGWTHVSLGEANLVTGPVIAEDRLRIGPGCVVGHADRPTTVRAGDIEVRSGSVVHGTVWASRKGEVRA
jgi:hypothetical protein